MRMVKDYSGISGVSSSDPESDTEPANILQDTSYLKLSWASENLRMSPQSSSGTNSQPVHDSCGDLIVIDSDDQSASTSGTSRISSIRHNNRRGNSSATSDPNYQCCSYSINTPSVQNTSSNILGQHAIPTVTSEGSSFPPIHSRLTQSSGSDGLDEMMNVEGEDPLSRLYDVFSKFSCDTVKFVYVESGEQFMNTFCLLNGPTLESICSLE